MMELIKGAFKHLIDSNVTWSEFAQRRTERLSEYINMYGNDRRYKLHVLAMSISTYPSAIVRYMGVKYHTYYDHKINDYVVELA